MAMTQALHSRTSLIWAARHWSMPVTLDTYYFQGVIRQKVII